MTADFRLSTLQAHLANLRPERLAGFEDGELALTLTSFIFSAGQCLPLPPEPPGWPSEQLLPFSQRYLPFFVAADFPGVTRDQVITLALATACRALYIVLLDRVVDSPATTSAEVKLALSHVLLADYLLLGRLFPPASPFWPEFNRLMALTSEGILAEQLGHFGRISPYSWGEYERIAWHKMAIVQVQAVALAWLNHSPQDIPFLQACYAAISLAGIVNDDINDWLDDYRHGIYSYHLTAILLSPAFAPDVQAGQLPDPAEVGLALFCSDLAETMYDRARDKLRAVESGASQRGYPALARLIDQTGQWLARRCTELTGTRVAQLCAMLQP